jgi:hypothetical protein
MNSGEDILSKTERETVIVNHFIACDARILVRDNQNTNLWHSVSDKTQLGLVTDIRIDRDLLEAAAAIGKVERAYIEIEFKKITLSIEDINEWLGKHIANAG